MKYFVQLGKRCPKVLICTHFHEILGLADEYQHQIEHLTMDVVIHESATPSATLQAGNIKASVNNLDRLVFLYKLAKKSATSSSFGMYCAYLAGVPVEILQRSAMISYKMEQNEPIEPIEANPRDLERLWKFWKDFDCNQGDIRALLEEVRRT